MTVSTTTSERKFTGNGVTTVFPLEFEIESAEHLVVSVIQTNGVPSPKTLNVEYTVSGVGEEAGATVTLGDPLEVGEFLLVRRVTPRTQPVELLPNAGFNPEAVGNALDRMALIVQEAGDVNDRSLVVPVGEVGAEIPAAASRAGKVFGFGDSGQPIAVEQLAAALISELWQQILLTSTVTDARRDLFVPAYVRNASVIDFDALGAGSGSASTGIYATSDSGTGLPSGEDGVGGHIIALNYNPDPDEGQQLYLAPSGNIYIRGRTGGSFGSWARLVPEGAAGRTLLDLLRGDEYITTLTASNSTQLDFTGFNSGRYTGYRLLCQNLKPQSDAVSLRLRLGTSGIDSSALYDWSCVAGAGSTPFGDGGAAATVIGLNPTATSTLGNAAAENGWSGEITLLNPHTNGAYKRLNYQGSFATPSTVNVGVSGQGAYANAGSLDSLRLFMSSGNIASGTVIVQGIRSAA